ncbi:M48 family metalloprotease [Anaeroselena agilis]|uniref:M48 family metalloprotease n=1 Tax=Anaeroselena agilis TaxID=3063788 RepID=A0ABU3P3J4_9FIRM|nr:M48 family metalloprotease [Selenomonadales bacterium 4137-cl]
MKKYVASALISLIILFGFTPRVVQAASAAENLLYAAAAYAYINGQLQNINDNHQQQRLAIDQRKTGIDNDPDVNERLGRLYSQLKANGQIKSNYALYVSPEKDLNAFCDIGRVICVYRGNFDLTDDEVAFTLAHELRHGEAKHNIAGVQKLLGLSLIVNLFLQRNDNTTSEILAAVAANYINNEIFTMGQEWEADEYAFNYAVAAGFNPGAGAANMARIRKKHGEIWVEGLARLINPNNHPKTSARVAAFSKKMTDYSRGKVTVAEGKTGAAILVKGQLFMVPKANYGQIQDERAYLIAGKIARAFHQKPYTLTGGDIGDDGEVLLGDIAIVTPGEGEEPAEVLAERLNVILAVK